MDKPGILQLEMDFNILIKYIILYHFQGESSIRYILHEKLHVHTILIMTVTWFGIVSMLPFKGVLLLMFMESQGVVPSGRYLGLKYIGLQPEERLIVFNRLKNPPRFKRGGMKIY